MYVLYEVSTGRLISQSSLPITNVGDGRATKEVSGEGIWNETSLDFDPIPVNRKKSTLSFMELFTDSEMVGILDAAKVNTSVQLFVMKMEQASYIDLDYPATIAGVQSLEAGGLLSAGRAEEILNG